MIIKSACSVLLAAATFGALPALAATAGSCLSAARSVNFSATSPENPGTNKVFLTWAYDEDTKTYDTTNDLRVCYFKATLSRGQAYTVWMEGPDVDADMIEFVDIQPVPATSDDQMEPVAMFSEVSGRWGTKQVLAKDEWYIDEEDPEMSDPTSWSYYFYIAGPASASNTTFCFAKGLAIPVGIEENPFEIDASTYEEDTAFNASQKKAEFQVPHLFVTNEFSFVFQADFLGGYRYLFAPVGGSAADPYDMSFEDGKMTPYGEWTTAGNAAYTFDPTSDGEQLFSVYQLETNNPVAKLNLRFKMLPHRSLGDHNPATLPVPGSVAIAPRRINSTNNEFYDDIIDGPLYGFNVVKGQRYLVETTGATTNLLLRIYDADGELLYENTECGDGSGNVRRGFTAKANGLYYAGVAVNLRDDDVDDPGQATAVLHVLSGESVEGTPDAWDDADDETAGATLLTVFPYGQDAYEGSGVPVEPYEVDKDGSAGYHELGRTDWSDVFAINARKGLRYRLRVRAAEDPFTDLKASVFTLNGTKEVAVTAGGSINDYDLSGEEPLTFLATKNGLHYIRLTVSEGYGVSYPKYKVHAAVYDPEVMGGEYLGQLKVVMHGTDKATWTLNSESVKYTSGETIVLPEGKYRVKFSSVSGYTTPTTLEGVDVDHDESAFCEVWYNDKNDPKDDYPSGKGLVDGKSVTYAATSWSVSTKETFQSRTLWTKDVADCFAIAGKDGAYYDFDLVQDGAEDAVFSITNAESGVICKGVTSVEKLTLPALKSKYYLIVSHKDAKKPLDTSYVLGGFYANVGAIKFSKTAVKVKDTATSVTLTVNRTAKDGSVRVKYETVDDEAIAGTNYVAQTGYLEWANGDNKAKTITIKLIPKLIAAYNGGDKDFEVRLTDAAREDDYKASILADTATVTIQESSKETVTVESVYAKKAPKLATTKTEEGALRGGTFYGVIRAAKGSLENGFPELAAVTLTVSAKGGLLDTSKDTLSAKVALAGKTYTFKTASKEEAWDDPLANPKTKTLSLVSKVAGVSYTNTLALTVADGLTTDESAWLDALATAKLTMNVPDADNKGVQEDIVYAGDLYRQNAKIQAYLNVVTNFTGYYTVALANTNRSAAVAPAGHGYLTLTVDNKGTAKVAGLLADNTKLSFSVTASAVREDGKGGYEMRVPLYAAKSPYCFGGEICLRHVKIEEAKPDGKLVNPDGKDFDVLVSPASADGLVWNNDNAKLTYDGTDGWALALQPVGGWYDTVFNLQNYYKDYAFCVSTADILKNGFPKEALASGYKYVTDEDAKWQANGYPVDLQGDALAVDKKTIVKDGKLTDLVNSVNPFNVQLKLARATGIVTGSFSLWSENESGTAQKEITGLKHYGILLLQRGESDVLGDENLTAGFFNQTVKVPDGTRTRNWTMSKPFNIVEKGIDE